MANPNIVNVTDIRGKTDLITATTTLTTFISNGAESNKVIKVNSLTAAEKAGITAQGVTVAIERSGNTFSMVSNVTIPIRSTLDIISKSIYLQEGDSLKVSSTADASIDLICSYEEIS